VAALRPNPARFPGVFSSARAEDGFGLIEMMMAMAIFAVVSAPLAGVLLASISSQKLAKERTLAAQAAQTAIEGIRALPYSDVGTPTGNPPGTVAGSQQAGVLGVTGLDATVTTRITYMDDAPSTSYRTRADYKRVIVTVTRNADQRRLTQAATYVAPPGGGQYAGQNEGIALVQVIDGPANTPIVGANVAISGGPSPLRNDTTDASGAVVFPSLLPTNATYPQYALNVTAAGYATMREDKPPSNTAQSSIVGGQTFQTVLRLYKPSTITVLAQNADATPYTGTATATVDSSRGSQSFTFTGGTLTVSSIAGELVVPNVQYTARLLAPNGMYSTPTTALVPNQYPTDNTKTFTLVLGGTATTMVTLTVRVVNASGARVSGAAVTVSGGPGSNVLLSGTSDSSGNAVFSIPSNATPGYTASATSGTLTGSAAGGVTANTTRTVTVR
jgi:prepilin-type N-terminal cleavage/methylation domain-containing protein